MNHKSEGEITAVLTTAVLCTVKTGKNRRFRFCIPGGGAIIDFDEMECLAKEHGVTEPQWIILMDKIEEAMESLC